MLSDRTVEDAPRSGRWFVVVCEALVVAAWFLLVLRDQYGVASLQPHEIAIDALFLMAVAGVLAARVAARRGAAHLGVALSRLSFQLVMIGAVVVGTEYLARYLTRNIHSSGNASDFVARRSGGPPIAINRLGFRDREFMPKSPGRYRIVVMGDSFTWGQGLEADQRYTSLLEAFLGPTYEVLNLGQLGRPDHLELVHQALATSPDFILFQLYVNDFETDAMQRPRPYPLLPTSLDERLHGSSVLYDIASEEWVQLQTVIGVSESFEQYMARHLRDPNSPNSRQVYAMLTEVIRRSRTAGVPVGVVLFPATDAMGAFGAHYPFGYLHDRIRTLCTDEKIPCLDLLATFSKAKDPKSLWVSPFDAHPNAAANRTVSYEILHQFNSAWHH